MSDKPVYIAGQGFQSIEEEPPRRLRPILAWVLLALLAAWAAWQVLPRGRMATLEVGSHPPGAEILINLAPTGRVTPDRLRLPSDQTVLVQVRLAGFQAEPTAQRLTPGQLRRGARLDFALRPLAPGHPVAALSPVMPPPAPVGEAPTASTGLGVGLSGLLEGTLATPAPPRHETGAGSGFLELNWQRWDPAFRLKVDGRVLPVQGARALPAGTHRVQVDLASRVLLDTLLAGSGPRLLALPPRERFVEIQVAPPEAEIVAGEQVLGQGRCLLHRADLPLELRFPPLPGLLQPSPIHVGPDAPPVLRARHHPPILLGWPAAGGGLRLSARGFAMPGEAFHEDAAHGARLEQGALLLGRAFHDRRPGGSQAALFEFDLPEEVNPGWRAELVLMAEDSGQRYPLTLSRGATLTLSLNGTALARELGLEDGQRRAWPVSSLLRPGRNELSVQSGVASRSAARLRSLEVRIGS